MSDGSDIEMYSTLPKKLRKKMPTSPSQGIIKKISETKKITTKEMIHDALIVQKNRKGVSLQAIKKHLKEKYEVDIERMKNIIKKNMKNGVENGSIVQVKGIGASGSFKLVEKKPEKKKKIPADTENTKKMKKPSEKSKKPKLTEEKSEKPKKVKSMEKVVDKKPAKKTEAAKPSKPKSTKLKTNKKEVEKAGSKIVSKPSTKNKVIIMKRKSIGSIIKRPKMKPKAATKATA